jgi:probable rRNA maturation factor
MVRHTVEIQVEEVYLERVSLSALQEAALAVLAHQGCEDPVELAVVISGDETLHELNLRHRDVDRPTDVLAFPHETRGPFVSAPGFPRYLGDVVISFPQAARQADQAGHALTGELQLLVVHGVLHLLGHDDQSEPERALMWAAQAEIIQRLDVHVNLPD